MADAGKVMMIIGCIGMAGAVETDSSWILSLIMMATGAILILTAVMSNLIDDFRRELSFYNDYKEHVKNKARNSKR